MQNDVRQYITPEMLKYFDSVKDRIVCRMVNIGQNRDFLRDKPFMKVGDMAASYHVDLGEKDGKFRSFAVTDTHMRVYGITWEELHRAAVENMAGTPVRFCSIEETIKKTVMDGSAPEEAQRQADEDYMPDDTGMYIITNESGVYGAAQMLNPEAIDMAAERLGGDFFILPSSVHEILVMPKVFGMDYGELENMVREVNMACVRPKEQLSDHVYQYDAGTKTIACCDRPRERVSVKLHDPGAERGRVRFSLVADLEAKKIQAEKLNKNPAKKQKNEPEL